MNSRWLASVCTWLGLAVITVASPAALALQSGPTTPLLRQPALHGDTVVFVCGGDLWTAPVAGGVARRLTLHDGRERFPRFSPDGSQIAFTGEYDGNSDVYVTDVHGGAITRVTFHPGSDEVVGWHPTRNKILFRSSRSSFNRFTRLFLISPDGTGLEELPLHEAAYGSFSPDGSRIAYNRVAREHRTWKRYHGGLAQDVYLYDFASGEDQKLTQYDGTDRRPMWIGDAIYFTSDRSRQLNLFAYETSSGTIAQRTKHDFYDARRPSAGDRGRIVYELGGDIALLDVNSGETRVIAIEVRADTPERRPYVKDVSGEVGQVSSSPTGKRALIVARGEVFSVPRKHGPTRNLSQTSGAREKDAAWSPDGRFVAYVSDRSGEYSLHLVDSMGAEEPRKLTTHASGYRHTLRWSPDSKRIAFADQTLRCFILDVDSGEVTEVDRSASEPTDVGIDLKPIHDYRWSPDSRHLAYSRIDKDLVSRVYIYSLESGERHCVSGDLFNDFGPVFSRDGLRLFFISNRRFDPTYCDFEWELVYKKVAGIYCVTLAKGVPALLPPRSDDEEHGDGQEDDTESAETVESGVVPIEIDFDGIATRIEPLPLPRGNYRRLSTSDEDLFYLDRDEGDFNRFEYRAVTSMDLHGFGFESRKERTVIKAVNSYDLSADGDTIAYHKGSKVGLIASTSKDSGGEAVSLGDLSFTLNPVEEWQQIFAEAWRMERDFFYEPKLHGLDWPSMLKKYGARVPEASSREDVRYLIGEMIGELATSHTYIFGGDSRRTGERVNVGLLGADFDLDAASGRYRVRKIYAEHDWTLGVVPPLAQVGVDVQAGDYLFAVDGEEVTGERNLFSYFQGLAGKQTRLMFGASPNREDAREVTVTPAGSERVLRYRDWLEHNRRVVAKASGGTIGYLHLPDTYLSSAREFPKYFYGQTQMKGLIVDGRFNGGGLDPDIFLQRLDKQLLTWWTRRYSMEQTTPALITRAHMVCLTNRQAGSGGDMLPMEFQMKKMGPVIGTRTWGGLVGVSMFYSLIDGGGLTAPDYRIYTPEGRWIVENEGVTPDIEVDLTPSEMARGHDAQLMKGVEVLLKQIAKDPLEVPAHPAIPKY